MGRSPSYAHSALEPADLAAGLERETRPLAGPGPGDHFRGYSVLGLSFADGSVLALRRFPCANGEPPYTSVWHRTREGRWTFYADTPGEHGCTRYFAPTIAEAVVTPIRIEWLSLRRLTVCIDGGRLLHWSIDLIHSTRSRLISALSPRLPRWCWHDERALRALERLVGASLGLGQFRLAGRTPSGHHFRLRPHAIWQVAASRARIDGRDLGPLAPLDPQDALADVWIPRRGLFVAADVDMLEPRP